VTLPPLTPVFKISAGLTGAFLLFGAVAPGLLAHGSDLVHRFLLDTFGWFYLTSVAGFLICAIYLIFSRFGHIRLGQDGDRPEYRLVTWFAMLFCAGMGIGLVFWGVAEPTLHYYNPPAGPGQTAEAARLALRYSFFHWGFHPWAIYAMVGLALAHLQFRKRTPGLISESCRPLLGKWVEGSAGCAIDTMAVFATVFGVATSLGFGAMQISGGLSYLLGTPNTVGTHLILIAAVTVLFMSSAQTGLQRGIKYLSNVTVVLALSLLAFLFVIGPTKFLMSVFISTLGNYLSELPRMSLQLAPFGDQQWIQDWTLFYWAWWIAWAPFVGTFIARISKGRTVREFVLGVLLVPTVFCGLWFSVFGGTAISLEMNGDVGIKHIIDVQGKEIALFSLLDHFPLGAVMSTLAIFLVAIFFITSADSATFVLGTFTTRGELNPPNPIKFVWGVVQSTAAAVLLLSGGLKGLQTAAIIVAFPFAIVMIVMVVSLFRSFQKEVKAEAEGR
jgi:glycine betaine transporter